MGRLSRNLICISVTIDVHKTPVAAVCGHGKPAGKRIMDTLSASIAEGTTFLHDKERTHSPLIRAVKSTGVAFKANVKNPDYLDGIKMFNASALG